MITLTKEEVIARAQDASTMAAEATYHGIFTSIYKMACENNRYWQRKLDEIDEAEGKG